MKKESLHHISNGTNDTFGFTILRRGVGTGEPKHNAMGGKVIVKLGAVVFASIVTLKGFDIGVKLSLNKFVELDKQIKHLRFILNRKNPKKMSKIIQKY